MIIMPLWARYMICFGLGALAMFVVLGIGGLYTEVRRLRRLKEKDAP